MVGCETGHRQHGLVELTPAWDPSRTKATPAIFIPNWLMKTENSEGALNNTELVTSGGSHKPSGHVWGSKAKILREGSLDHRFLVFNRHSVKRV